MEILGERLAVFPVRLRDAVDRAAPAAKPCADGEVEGARPPWLATSPLGVERPAVRVVAERIGELMAAAARG